MKIILSKASIICSASLQDMQKGDKHFLTPLNDYTNNSYLLGKIHKLKPLAKDIEMTMQTRTNTILYNALLPLLDIIENLKSYNFAISIGTTTTGVEENYLAIKSQSYNNTYIKERSALCNPASFLNKILNLHALNFGISSACTSGAKAIIDAARLIKSNMCDVAICGATDSLNTLTINGFKSLEILSNDVSKAFSKNRDGINIGEGAALFIMISENVFNKLESKMKKHFKVELKGYVSNNDAFHITNPRVDNKELESLLYKLLEQSNLTPNDIDYINLHGTGTKANDSMESNLISKIFPNTLCSTIKPFIGHTLGAAGAIEAGICANLILESLESKSAILPPYFSKDSNEDMESSDIASINLVKKNQRLCVKNAISTSFAFGGDNAILLLGLHNEY